MVAQADIPALSTHDADLLAAFLNPAVSLAEIAERSGLPFTALLAWAARPEIKAELDAMRTLASMRADLHAHTFHTPALLTLTTLLESCDNPVESRRIASTVLRNTAPARRRARAPASTSELHAPDDLGDPELDPERPAGPAADPPQLPDPALVFTGDEGIVIRPLPGLHIEEPPDRRFRGPRQGPHALHQASGRAEPLQRPPRSPPRQSQQEPRGLSTVETSLG